MGIKDFLKPTTAKVLTVLFVYIGIWLVQLIFSLLFSVFIPEIGVVASSIQGGLEQYLEQNIPITKVFIFFILSFIVKILVMYIAVCIGFYINEKKNKTKVSQVNNAVAKWEKINNEY